MYITELEGQLCQEQKIIFCSKYFNRQMAAINLLLWEEGIKVIIRENDVCRVIKLSHQCCTLLCAYENTEKPVKPCGLARVNPSVVLWVRWCRSFDSKEKMMVKKEQLLEQPD